MTTSRVVFLACDGFSSAIVYNYLTQHLEVAAAVLEPPVPKLQTLRRRSRKLGLRRTVSQAAFAGLVTPLLARTSKARRRRILEEAGLSDAPIPSDEVIRVETVNSELCRTVLRSLEPAVVIINGTRIIGRATLGAVEAPFINMHAGMTPRYRGVHGAYWALADGHPEWAGVTVHLVDEGIDTGSVLAQSPIRTAPEDNFTTYPLLQMAAGLPELVRCAKTVMEGRRETIPPKTAGSELWYHPTLAEYGWHRLTGRAK